MSSTKYLLAFTLFNGRKTPDEEAVDWGEAGPTFVGMENIHTVTECETILVAKDRDLIIRYEKGCLFYNGMYYSDAFSFIAIENKKGISFYKDGKLQTLHNEIIRLDNDFAFGKRKD